jgi:adenine-specific DNA-methyltransferase
MEINYYGCKARESRKKYFFEFITIKIVKKGEAFYMSDNGFNDRPHVNEKKDSIAFVKSLIEQARSKSNMGDIPKLEKIVELLASKRYGLVWERHVEKVDEAMKTMIPIFTEDLSKKINDNDKSNNYNFILEGDNLHSLHLLEKTHFGKIDIIYIDPPYNTGTSDGAFKYNDRLVDNTDSFIHSKWLSFMERRLRIAFNLLSEAGVIFVSIDDNEFSQLKLLLDDIFGERNFVTNLVWEKKKKGSFLSNSITNVKEYILVYSKRRDKFNGLTGEKNVKIETYPCINASNKREVRHIAKGIESKYKEKDFVIEAGTVISANTMNIKYLTDLIVKDGVVQEDFEVEGNWRYSYENMRLYSERKDLYVTRDLYIRRIVSEPRYKNLKDLLLRTGENNGNVFNAPINPDHLLESGWGSNEDADNELIAIFGKQKMFSYPKPTRLISKLLLSTYNDSAIVLDFFAGSGTTGQAVAELNAAFGGDRKFILATNNENNIAEEVTFERMKRVSKGTEKYQARPINLKYFKTAFIEKNDDNLERALLDNVKTMIELEHGVDLEQSEKAVAFTLSELKELNLTDVKTVYMRAHTHSLMEKEDLLRFKDIEIVDVPDYYFSKEMSEAGL